MVSEYTIKDGGKITFWSLEFITVGWTTEESWLDSRKKKTQEFSRIQNDHNSSGTHPTSCLVGTQGFSMGVRRPGIEYYYTPPPQW